VSGADRVFDEWRKLASDVIPQHFLYEPRLGHLSIGIAELSIDVDTENIFKHRVLDWIATDLRTASTICEFPVG
jgi:hypothetical protein